MSCVGEKGGTKGLVIAVNAKNTPLPKAQHGTDSKELGAGLKTHPSRGWQELPFACPCFSLVLAPRG